MIITKIEVMDKTKYKIYLDEEYAFWLYQKELDQFDMAEGTEISDAFYQKLMNEVIFEHAKEKALAILKFADRTELELKRKLEEAGYTDDIILRVIEYVLSYGYLNDERLTSVYTKSRMNKKSKQVIRSELLQKGVSSECIDQVFQEEYRDDPDEDAEMIAIRKAINKKTKNPEELDYEAKQKLIASLYRRGFEISKIKRVLG